MEKGPRLRYRSQMYYRAHRDAAWLSSPRIALVILGSAAAITDTVNTLSRNDVLALTQVAGTESA